MSRTAQICALFAFAACAPNYHSTYEGPRSDLLQPPEIAPPLIRYEVVRTEKAIEDVTVTAVPHGATGWTIQIQNAGEESLSVVWDESTFVTAAGESTGRLVRGETRRIDSGKPQPNSPLPPGSKLIEIVFPEKTLEVEEEENRLAGNGRYGKAGLGLQPRAYDETMRGRAERAKGGRLHVVVNSPDDKQTWTGLVEPTIDDDGRPKAP